MAPKKDYKGLIWTNHVIERLHQRKIPQEWAWRTYRFPDASEKGKESKTLELTKTIEGHKISLIIKKNEKNEWLLLSCWAEPPLLGSIDAKRTFYKKKEQPTIFTYIYRFIKSTLFPIYL